MRRRQDGSGFDAITWGEAFAQIAERLLGIVDECGPRALGMTLGVPSFDRYWAYRLYACAGLPNVYGADGACEVRPTSPVGSTAWVIVRLRPSAYRLHHVPRGVPSSIRRRRGPLMRSTMPVAVGEDYRG